MTHVISFTVADVLRFAFVTLPAALFWAVMLWALVRYTLEQRRRKREKPTT